MEKKPYARIEFINCEVNYGHTICPWSEVESQIQVAQSQFEDVDEKGFNYWKDNGYLPSITITLVMLTESEWQKAFSKYEK